MTHVRDLLIECFTLAHRSTRVLSIFFAPLRLATPSTMLGTVMDYSIVGLQKLQNVPMKTFEEASVCVRNYIIASQQPSNITHTLIQASIQRFSRRQCQFLSLGKEEDVTVQVVL